MPASKKAQPTGIRRALLPSFKLPRGVRSGSKKWAERSATERALIIATALFSALFLTAGIIHIAQEPTNPAVYILFLIFSTPALGVYYWDAFPLKNEPSRPGKTTALVSGMVWSAFALNITMGIVPQLVGFVAILVWGIVLAAFWFVSIFLLNAALEGRLWSACARLLKARVG